LAIYEEEMFVSFDYDSQIVPVISIRRRCARKVLIRQLAFALPIDHDTTNESEWLNNLRWLSLVDRASKTPVNLLEVQVADTNMLPLQRSQNLEPQMTLSCFLLCHCLHSQYVNISDA
jgi:hypothetical protein